MYIALEKRRENIAEYILYLWQLEDLMRALGFSPEAIYTQLVKPRGLDTDKENQLLTWYMGIADLLRQENKQQTGHISHTMHLIADLQRFHEQMMELPAGEKYRGLFARLEPELPRLRITMGKGDVSDMELAFRALYAAMLYRMKGGETAGQSINDVIELISPAVAELAHLYRRAESGDADIFREESR